MKFAGLTLVAVTLLFVFGFKVGQLCAPPPDPTVWVLRTEATRSIAKARERNQVCMQMAVMQYAGEVRWPIAMNRVYMIADSIDATLTPLR